MLCCSVWDRLASRWSLERGSKDESWDKAGAGSQKGHVVKMPSRHEESDQTTDGFRREKTEGLRTIRLNGQAVD